MDFFFYMDERFTATNGLIWIPEDNITEFISSEKMSFKRLYKLFRGTLSYTLIRMQFLAALNLSIGGGGGHKFQRMVLVNCTKIFHFSQ